MTDGASRRIAVIARTRTEQLLAAATERAAVERLVEAYRTVPPATRDDWGDLSTFGDLGTLESMQRLDAEEAVNGLERDAAPRSFR